MVIPKINWSIEQTDPPRPPRETLPTLYDLPSENLEEPVCPMNSTSLSKRCRVRLLRWCTTTLVWARGWGLPQ